MDIVRLGERGEAMRYLGSDVWHPATFMGSVPPLGGPALHGGGMTAEVPRVYVRFEDGKVQAVGVDQFRRVA